MKDKVVVMGRGPVALALLPGTSQQCWVAVWMEDRKLHLTKGCRSRCMDLPGHWLQEKHSYLLVFPLGDASSTLPLALLNCTVYTLGFTLFLLDQTPTEEQGRALLEEGLHNASAYGPESLAYIARKPLVENTESWLSHSLYRYNLLGHPADPLSSRSAVPRVYCG